MRPRSLALLTPGSAHCALEPYWWPRVGQHAAAGWLTGYQASARGGFVSVSHSSDYSRVFLRGVVIPVFTVWVSEDVMQAMTAF